MQRLGIWQFQHPKPRSSHILEELLAWFDPVVGDIMHQTFRKQPSAVSHVPRAHVSRVRASQAAPGHAHPRVEVVRIREIGDDPLPFASVPGSINVVTWVRKLGFFRGPPVTESLERPRWATNES